MLPDMNRQDVLTRLHRFIHKAGSQTAAAAAMDVSPQYLADVKYGRRDPGQKILDALGLCKVTHYEPAAKEHR